MKKIKLLITILLFFISINIVNASNRINSIDVEVKLDEYGNGLITEVWNMKVDKGSEVYKPIDRLGNLTISNFEVKDETGRIYTYVSNWNVDGTLSSKAYKNGINRTSKGIELCWGMSSYGNHTYTISYKVTNMIFRVEDADVLYFQFINDQLTPPPRNFSVKVSGPQKYEDTLDVWGYGYKGYAYVSDGYIYMANQEKNSLSLSDYAVLLAKFPINSFNTQNRYEQFATFDDVLAKAKVGSFSYNYNEHTFLEELVILLPIIVNMAFWIIFIVLITRVKSPDMYIKKEIDKSNLNSFRDIPCNKDIMKAYFLSNVYKLNKKKEDLLGAILLKWLLDKKITIVKQTKTGIFGSKEITAIKLNQEVHIDSPAEMELYKIMVTASGDYLLETDELKKWCRNNYSKYYKWFDTAAKEIRDKYIAEGHITKAEKGFRKYNIDNYLYEEATRLAGLKKYLVEFSRMKEKQPIEVNIWEYYLIYAQIFGIAKEVSKQFKDLYPELIEKQYDGISLYDDILMINNITTVSASAASSARSAAESYSGGGGGFSSGGGGGGSFGGGSGGGCR